MTSNQKRAISGLSVVAVMCFSAAMCSREKPLLKDPAPKPRIEIKVRPEVAFATTPIEVVVVVYSHPANRAVFLGLDGGEGFFSASSFEVMPNAPVYRRFTFTKPGREGDGLIVVTATLHGELGPLVSAEKHIYRRLE